MQARLQKLSANKDQMDSIQFQMREDEVADAGEELLALRRYDCVTVKYSGNQTQMEDDGKVSMPTLEFQAMSTSISLCLTEDGIIATLTFSFEDSKVFDHVIRNKLRDCMVDLICTRGKNPFIKK